MSYRHKVPLFPSGSYLSLEFGLGCRVIGGSSEVCGSRYLRRTGVELDVCFSVVPREEVGDGDKSLGLGPPSVFPGLNPQTMSTDLRLTVNKDLRPE